ncbi:energy transducer TonB [Shewanella algae]|uniref:energy transducer TonB n=1 Tax=Shewanella algae TaxID=38313 RepID=UPI001AAEEAB4|nr:energy transducer TonB [Shewanella algae]MBO2579460.1 TonB family protein [Shewanella algae]BCV64044.1 TonB1 energy transduction system for heme uptake energy transducer component TonB [Shewanella algae]
MTPKRYCGFALMALSLQSAVLASQTATPDPLVIPTKGGLQLSFSAAPVAASQTASVQTQNQTATAESHPAAKAPSAKHKEAEHKAPQHQEPLKQNVAKPEPPKSEQLKTKPVKTSQKQTSKMSKPQPTQEKPREIAEKSEPKHASTTPRAEPVPREEKPGIPSLPVQTAGTPGLNHTIELAEPVFASPPTPPSYPRLARKRGFEGTALVDIFFDHQGKTQNALLVSSSGYSILDEAALAAVRHWQFSIPSQASAARFKVRVPVRFALN